MAAAEITFERMRIGLMTRATLLMSNQRSRDAIVLLAYFFAMALWFHRLLFHLNDAVLYGPNDESYGIRQYWSAAYEHKTPFTQTRDPLNGAPEGLPMGAAIQVANAVIPATIWGLHYFVGFTAASNIFLVSGIVISAFAFYYLLVRLGIHPFAAFYAGYALTLNPWMLERAGAGHSGFMQSWIFPLLIAVMLYAHRKHTIGAAVLVGLTLALAFYDNSYYGLMAGLVWLIFWLLDIARQPTWNERLWRFTLADISFASAVIAFLPALVVWLQNKRAVGAGISNSVAEVQSLGATTQAYFLPSFRNPILNHITLHFYPQAAFVWSENTLYLGWSLIVLGAIGAYFVFRKRPETFARPLTRYFFIAMVILAPAAFFTSLQRETTWFGVTFPTPSYVIAEFTTFWRVFARFGLLVTLALAALAALTLTVVIRRYRYGWLIAVAAFGLLVFEYYDGVLPIYILKPTAYSNWIAKQPDGIVANYPLPTDQPQALRLLAETYYEQIYNKHPEFTLFGSGYGETREDAIRVLVRYVTDPATPSVLKAEGVKYILLHDTVYRAEGETPPPIPAGFHLVARIPGDVRALEINNDVKPADLPAVLEANAVSIAEAEGLAVPSARIVPLTGRPKIGAGTVDPTAEVKLNWNSPLPLKRVQMIVVARSTGKPRTLAMHDVNGGSDGSFTIGTNPTQVTFGPVDVSGSGAKFELSTSPADRVVIQSITVQPLADFSVSIRDY